MSLRSSFLLPLLLAIGACALESPPPDESTADQQLTANEIDSSWFSDAQFTKQVGESDLYCSGGKYQSGQVPAKYVARFTWPCNGAGGQKPTCFEYNGLGDYVVVNCPAYLF